jgi:hypothetical protein
MTLGAIDIPTRDVAYFRKVLNGLEVELSGAKARRDKILLDIRKASAAVDASDRQARFAQGGLNKEADAVGRLILSIEGQVAEARKRVEMAEVQAAAAAAKRASIAQGDSNCKGAKHDTPSFQTEYFLGAFARNRQENRRR